MHVKSEPKTMVVDENLKRYIIEKRDIDWEAYKVPIIIEFSWYNGLKSKLFNLGKTVLVSKLFARCWFAGIDEGTSREKHSDESHRKYSRVLIITFLLIVFIRVLPINCRPVYRLQRFTAKLYNN